MHPYNSTFQKGRKAEKRAEEFLLGENYQILAKNFYFHHREIDLIGVDLDCQQIVFFEVKSLVSERQISIYNTVRRQKKRKIISAALYWLQKNDKINCDFRIDFIGIVLDNIIHIKSAIY